MRILITGGAGFIGSHLAEKYLKDGDEVYIIDDLSTGSLNNLQRLRDDVSMSKRLHLHVDSILNESLMAQLIGTCEVVIHLAAAVGVSYIIDNPLSSIITNIRGTEKVLELCEKFKKKVFIASTSEVYGKRNDVPLIETDDCVYGPSNMARWSYAAAKLMDEFTAIAYYKTKKLPVCIARFFNVVGPRQTGQYGMVIPRFIKQALNNEPITVYGNGEQTRTFTDVTEVVHCVQSLIENNDSHGEVVNIGGVEEVTIIELATRIKEMTNSESEIIRIPYNQAYPKDFEDMQRRVPSTEKLKGIISYSPEMELDSILKKTIQFFREEEKVNVEESEFIY